jgi:hypothetical protein
MTCRSTARMQSAAQPCPGRQRCRRSVQPPCKPRRHPPSGWSPADATTLQRQAADAAPHRAAPVAGRCTHTCQNSTGRRLLHSHAAGMPCSWCHAAPPIARLQRLPAGCFPCPRPASAVRRAPRLQVWKCTEAGWQLETVLDGHGDWCRDAAWAPNLGLQHNTIATAGQDGQVRSAGAALPGAGTRRHSARAAALLPARLPACMPACLHRLWLLGPLHLSPQHVPQRGAQARLVVVAKPRPPAWRACLRRCSAGRSRPMAPGPKS